MRRRALRLAGYRRESLITPTQAATNGALAIYVEGFQRDDTPQMLVGLSVLRSATETQVRAAMPFVQLARRVTLAEIAAMLTGQAA